MKERRKHPRAKHKSRVYVTVLSSPENALLENKTVTCGTEDIASGGVRLSLPKPLPKGAALELRIVSRKNVKTCWHVGRVVWCKTTSDNSHEIGVKFTETPETTLIVWEELIRDKLARNGD